MNQEKPNGQHVDAETPPLPRWDVESEPQRRSYWWVWLLVIGILGVAGYLFRAQILAGVHTVFGSNAAAAAPKGGRNAPVVTAVAKEGDMDVFLNGLGAVTPLKTVTVRTRVDGQIDSVNFTEGQMVKKGDLLIQIDPRPFQAQLEQAQGQMVKDQAALQDAQLDLQRYKDLAATNSIAKQQVDTQAALVHQDEGAVAVDQAQIDTAKLQLVYAHITSPIDGRIGLRLVDEGNIVHATDTTGLAVVAQVQPTTVIFTLPEDDIPKVLRKMATGQPVRVDAYDRDLKTRIATGKLLAIDNQIDPGSGTLRFKAEFPNEDGMLFPNQFVNARLLINTLHNQVIVPTAAVQRGPSTQPSQPTSTFVYVVDMKEKTVALMNVKIGATEGDFTAVASGLKPGDVVVTDGVDKLVPGGKVSLGKASTRPSTLPTGEAGAGAAAAGAEHQHHGGAAAGEAPAGESNVPTPPTSKNKASE